MQCRCHCVLFRRLLTQVQTHTHTTHINAHIYRYVHVNVQILYARCRARTGSPNKKYKRIKPFSIAVCGTMNRRSPWQAFSLSLLPPPSQCSKGEKFSEYPRLLLCVYFFLFPSTNCRLAISSTQTKKMLMQKRYVLNVRQWAHTQIIYMNVGDYPKFCLLIQCSHNVRVLYILIAIM